MKAYNVADRSFIDKLNVKRMQVFKDVIWLSIRAIGIASEDAWL